MSNTTDDLADATSKHILNGAQNLIAVLDEVLVEHILEIKTNVNSKQNLSLLKRIEKTIDQYLKRTRDLFYIGFLGHYSSGKSSTINSVLNLKGSRNERVVNNNPTDDQMTLITNSNNTDQIVKLIRAGSVPIVTKTIDDEPFLSNKVIIDTPGSGDPSTFEEIVRDSLPLCDLIIYCISAANPLTNSDIPLLHEKEKNLKDIPTIYVVTRGNEFKKNSLQLLSDENFDKTKATIFLSELASRIKVIIPSINLTHEDFILIDNVDDFHLNFLAEEIVKLANPVNAVKLHGHKVSFFLRTLNDIKSFFLNAINEKFLTINSFVIKAQTNIDDYDKKTIIGNDKLINNWKNVDDRVKQVIDGSISQNNFIQLSLNTPLNFKDINVIQLWYSETLESYRKDFKRVTDNAVTNIANNLYDQKEKLKEYLYEVIGNGGNLRKDEIREYESENQNKQNVFEVNISISYNTKYERFYQDTFRYLDKDRYENLKRNLNSVQSRVAGKNPVESINKNIDEAKTILAEIFESYNGAVHIYRVAAFSSEAKNYIRKLGLSEKLDLLDTNLPNTEDYLEKAQEEIFGNYYIELKTFEKECERLDILLKEIQIDTPMVSLPDKEFQLQEIQKKFQQILKNTHVEIKEKYDKKAIDRVLEKIEDVNSGLLSRSIQKQKKIDEIRRKQLEFYAIRLIPAVVILISTIIMFYYLPKWHTSNSLSVGWQWILGIFGNLVFSLLNGMYVKSKDKHPQLVTKVTDDFKIHEKQAISEIVYDGYSNFQNVMVSDFSKDVNIALESQLIKDLSTLLSKEFTPSLHELYTKIREKESQVKNVIEQYSKALNSLKLVITSVLNDNKKNKEILAEQAVRIKESAINPSFELLENTKIGIQDVLGKVEKTAFY